jgi:cystathionine beta-synthase
VESIGHYLHPDTRDDLWPRSYDRSVVDRFERIGDRESIMTARRLGREEGLLVGGSAGTAVAAALRVAATLPPSGLVVVLIPDSGRSYLSKYFDDDWLRGFGFLEDAVDGVTVGDIVAKTGSRPVVSLRADLSVGEALALVSPSSHDLHPVALPRRTDAVTPNVAETVGVVSVAALAALVAQDRAVAGTPLAGQVTESLGAVGVGESVTAATAKIKPGQSAVWVLVDGRVTGVVTRDDLAG